MLKKAKKRKQFSRLFSFYIHKILPLPIQTGAELTSRHAVKAFFMIKV
ncbi:hypothetical protein Bateq7PJ16_1076 [Bacillus subtilis]|uniref:Uncharacterized protein n=2 Tax=Bacillus subtilis TaxID=1423 RepID=A0A0C3K2G8_BACIU|nr:hypothetical protein B4067_1107 [Bacillus subtilis subsp. subtilis]KIN27744.1 hypothetical protein B4069_0960 [Bacillus subtilis]CCU57412.1 hypothetical protein BSUBE1_0781 [Bacillus subtilis E1]BAI84502.1 hypothetical protein BSNT_07391 [Bacillus subtilis subsp. natto BEST195]GAK81449.1 hypothetical protein BSMD_033650 [Bacillus subtilis Miyagi-4]